MPAETEKERFEKSGGVEDRQLVVFKIANEEFGVDINEVKEIIRWTDVTRIPSTESYIKGVINLRGNIVVVNDLAMKLGLPSKQIDDETRILVVEVGENNTIGMVVDSATEVLRLDSEKVKAPPEMITGGIDQNYIDGVGVLDEKRLLTLLDLAKVMKSKDYEKIIKAQKIAQQNIKKEKRKEKKPEKPKEKEDKKETPKKKDDKKTDDKKDDKKSDKKADKTDSKEDKTKSSGKKEDKKAGSEENSKTSDKSDNSDTSKETDSSNKDTKSDKKK